MFERFTDRARRVTVIARDTARELGHAEIGPEHFLLAITTEGQGAGAKALERLGIPLVDISSAVRARIGTGPHTGLDQYPLATGTRKALEIALQESLDLGHAHIGTEHILVGIMKEVQNVAAQVLLSKGLEIGQVRREALLTPATPPPTATTTLMTLARNLDDGTAEIVGRRPDIDLVLQVLSRRARNVALLVGDPGVGKTSVAVGLAQAVARGEVPERFRGRTVLRLDVTALFTDPRHHGRFTEVMAELVGDVLRSSDLVLFLDNALSVVRTREGQAEALAFFRPVFDVPGISVVAAAGSADHRRWERDSGLDRRIQPVPVAEPTPEDVLQILRDARQRLVDHHEVVITDEALAAAARLAHGYLPGHALPGAAIDLLDEASAHVRSGPVAPGTTPSVTEDAVTRTAGTSAALPVAPRPPVLSPPVPHDPTVWAMS
ncbi:Clp protease N-terminal domain-containing protein [Kitasatospora sp. NPDC089913]|uniref:Clp protease N-terminal domain-containing protein n=1 Tax=Kitasatospora sp. NPDC089913 TaxID=3364080 RepID=UPI00382D58EC